MNYFRRVYNLASSVMYIQCMGSALCIKDVRTNTYKYRSSWVTMLLTSLNMFTCHCCILDTDAYINIKHWEI